MKTSKRKRVIVNADDFGFSEGVTEGILRAHREGIVTSTTIAANMPAAAAAVDRLTEAPDLAVGVHLNVCQGPVLSKAGRPLADADGVMRSTAGRLLLRCLLRPGLLAALEAECDAQVRWVLRRGLRPTHLDSHRHVHGFPPVFARVARIARRYDIPFIRRHREVLPGRGWPAAEARQRRIARATHLLGACCAPAARERLATTGTWGVAHTGQIGVAWLLQAARRVRPGATEIMTHPGLPDGLGRGTTRLLAARRAEMQALCDARVREAFQRNSVELVHYGQL